MPSFHTNSLRRWFDVEALMFSELPGLGALLHFLLRYLGLLPWQKAAAGMDCGTQKRVVGLSLVQNAVRDIAPVGLVRLRRLNG